MTITYTINDNSFEFEPEELKNFTNTIIREDGFENDEQVLREKTDTSLTFYGDAYCYLCDLRKQSPCSNIDFKLYINNELFFNGTFQLSDIEFNLTRKSAKTGAIKDATFVGVIDEVIDVEIKTYFSKTKNCEQLERKTINLEVYENTDLSNPKNILAFDVLDLFKQIVSYFSDNTVNVVSNYLTDNKVAITLGYNLDGSQGDLEKTYPSISFKTLFDELRKKYRIYMEVSESEIVIEQEDYFFEDTEVLRFDDLPFDAVEKFDIKRMFNELRVGSSDIEAEVVSYPQAYQKAWNEESYTSCGICLVQKDSEQATLDLVSDFIIDSNVIYEAVNGIDGNDSNIFMIEYYLDGGIAKAKMTDDGNGVYYYNDGFRNINVINNWLGYSPQCIALGRQAKYGFLYSSKQDGLNSFQFAIPTAFDLSTVNPRKNIYYDFSNNNLEHKIYDNENATVYNNNTPIAINPYGNAIPNVTQTSEKATYFVCQEDGVYTFMASSDFQSFPIPGGNPLFDDKPNRRTDYRLQIEVYQDNTFANLIDSYFVEVLDIDVNSKYELKIENAIFDLNSGNCVVLTFYCYWFGTNTSLVALEGFIGINNVKFSLIDDEYACQEVGENTSSRPYLLKFEREICKSDFEKLKQNKRGYILINGIKYWVGKSIEWNVKGFAEFELIGEDTQC